MIALGLVYASGASADLCFTTEGGGGTQVGKGFTLPTANTCKPFNGFEAGGALGAITGTGCVDEKGNTFILHYVYHTCLSLRAIGDSYFESGFCRFRVKGGFPAPGKCRGTVLSDPPARQTSFPPQKASLFNCNIAVPADNDCP
jgi:hypothetical protein